MAIDRSNISLKQLRAFAAVSHEGSFTRGAERLFLTQSALSALIRNLESELGVRLLDRTTRKLELTDAGHELLGSVERLLNDIEHMTTNLQDVAAMRRGKVRLGATPLLAATLLPQVLASFAQAYPGVVVRVVDAPATVLVEKLRAGELEFILATVERIENEMEAVNILSDQLVVVCAPDHALASRKSISWSAVRKEPLLMLAKGSGLRALADQSFEKSGDPPPAVQEVTHVVTAMAMAAAGLGVAIVPAYAQNALGGSKVVAVKLTQPAVIRQVSLVHMKQRSLSPASKALHSHLIGKAKEKAL